MKDAVRIKNLLSRKLLAWYKSHQRPLPWRETSDPYRIWISEIMLQQTQVDTVIPYYHRFLKVFPDVDTLARASLQDVLKVWENLGYYSRARNIHAAARMIVDRFDGRIPDTPDAIKTLPGIGEYSAGAILSIACGQALPAVDGNVRRILSRVLAIRQPVDEPREQMKLRELAAQLVPAERPGDFNQALMDLGATICRAKNPDCPGCPVKSICRARLLDLQNILPVTRKAPAIPRRLASAAVVRNQEDKLLLVQRPATGLLASLWKLPGGLVETGKKMENSLRHSVKKELGVTVRVGKEVACVDHVYTHFRLTLHAYEAVLLKGEPEALGCGGWRWAAPADIRKLPLSKIDRMVIAAIKKGLPFIS
ncbi:MAG: A/G-specific adenine glycosylase [Deltaproteobacteria bacterium HGW-Deltaproteobacteria-7]|nr:MAG: A/G-specific adenine glycosylase [Deltaproteobacteria bacterium HGW-Deltaproteobacteria-7]